MDTMFTLKFTKGRDSINDVGGVLVLVFCKSLDHVLYLYQVLWKYGALVAKWVKRWPTDLADRLRFSLEVKSSQP